MVRPALALTIAAGAAYAAGHGPRITLAEGVVEARPAAAEARLEVFVDAPGGLPPLLGAVSREGEALVFRPRFPLRPGMRYRAVYRDPSRVDPVVEVFRVPDPLPAPTTVLEHVFPSPDVLPENLLKLYLAFSAPMSRGEASRRVRLLDENGQTVELPFLEIDQELWDVEGRRLTLLFDPGRVKRDLLPNQEVGTPLRAGATYTLVVDREWPDAHGNPLAREGRKTFRVGPPDHAPPRTADWRLAPPRAHTRDPLTVRFPEPLDRALLERVLEVVDGSGSTVPGSVAVESQETRWLFTPRDPWRAGDYRLRVATILEDLAGNSLGRPFEVDVFERVEDRVLNVTESVGFRIE
jgi:hypothetical protein